MAENKIYIIKFDKVDYDEYIGFVIIAPNRARAIQIMLLEKGGNNVHKDNIESCEEIGTTNRKEGIVFDSYNAG